MSEVEPRVGYQTLGLVNQLRENAGWHDERLRCQTSPQLLRDAARRVEELEGALREIVSECRNGGYPNEIVATRMIERIEETALTALSEGSGSSRELAPPDESGDACGATERAEG